MATIIALLTGTALLAFALYNILKPGCNPYAHLQMAPRPEAKQEKTRVYQDPIQTSECVIVYPTGIDILMTEYNHTKKEE